MSTDTHLRQLVRSMALLLVLGAVVVALPVAVPSLAAVTRELGHAQAGWVMLALVAELASCFAFVSFFQGIFWRGPRRLAARLAWTEMAAGALLPAGGAGGLGLGALILSKLGMPGRAIAIRSTVVFLVTSAVTVGALSLFGLGLPTLVGTVEYVLLRGDLKRPIAPRSGSWPTPFNLVTPPTRGTKERLP